MRNAETHPGVTFIRNLYEKLPGNYVELRALPTNKKPGQERRKFVTTASELTEFANKYGARNSGYGVYFGVAKRLNDKAGKKDNCAPVTALWADVDTVKNGWDTVEVAKTFHAIKGVLRPTIAVNSGGGLHLYWLLSEAEPAQSIVELANKRLAQVFGGDNVQNVDRILRLPGTFNNKRKATECEVLWSYHWDKVCPVDLGQAALDQKEIFTGKWEKEIAVKKREAVSVEIDPLTNYVRALNAGNRNVSGNLANYWRDDVRYSAPRGYVGIHEAQLVTTARFHCAGIPPEIIVRDTLQYTEDRMKIDAPEVLETWNMKQEEEIIRNMLQTWEPKWVQLRKAYKALKKAEKERAVV